MNWNNTPPKLPEWQPNGFFVFHWRSHNVPAPLNIGFSLALWVYRSRERSWICPASIPKPSFSIAASNACSVPLPLFCDSCCTDHRFHVTAFKRWSYWTLFQIDLIRLQFTQFAGHWGNQHSLGEQFRGHFKAHSATFRQQLSSSG